MILKSRLGGAAVAVVVVLVLGPPAWAADGKDRASDISQLRELIQQQRAALERQEKALQAQKLRLEALEAQVQGASQARVRPAVHVPTPNIPRNRDSDRYRRYTQNDTSEGATSIEGPKEAKPEERPEVAAISDVGGVLLRKGRLVLEPSVNYVRSDVNRAEIAGFSVLPGIIIGNINVTEVSRNTVISALTARYGVTNRLEMEVKIPHVWRDDTTTGRPLGGGGADQDSVTSANGSDIGDIEFAAHYQINQGGGGTPYFIANFRGKSRTGQDPFEVRRHPVTNVETQLATGTGFWAFEPSLTVIYPTDPAVLYANLNYLINFKRNVSGFGEIDPGNALGINFGMGVALNEKLSFSLGYDHKQVQKTRLNGLAGTSARTLQVGRFLLGGSFRPDGPATINVTVGIGVTEDSPDLDVVVRVPVALDLFN